MIFEYSKFFNTLNCCNFFPKVLFAAILTVACAKPKPLVVDYHVPTYEYAAYTAPVEYSYSAHYDHHDHIAPFTTYSYEYAPYSYFEYLRRWNHLNAMEYQNNELSNLIYLHTHNVIGE